LEGKILLNNFRRKALPRGAETQRKMLKIIVLRTAKKTMKIKRMKMTAGMNQVIKTSHAPRNLIRKRINMSHSIRASLYPNQFFTLKTKAEVPTIRTARLSKIIKGKSLGQPITSKILLIKLIKTISKDS
jgi:hypothetical protein